MPFVIQKFESAEYGDESPRMVVQIKQKQGGDAKVATQGAADKAGSKQKGQQTQYKAVRPPEEAVFDIGKERNKGNQFWKQGKGREEHRAKEMAAKERRTNKGNKAHNSLKVQILEEPCSDEVSPGVTRTVSPSITVKSSSDAAAA